MTVRCPHCSTRYELPERLMGPAGAQVRCPSCRGVFAVAPDGAVRDVGAPAAPTQGPERVPDSASATREPAGSRAAARAPSSAAHGSAAPAASADPESVARALVSELAERAGEGPRESCARGRLFSEWGPALMELQGEYRRRVGAAASGVPLRAALRERWGIDLPEGDARGLGG